MRNLEKVIIRKDMKSSYGKAPEVSRYIVHISFNYGIKIHSYYSVSYASVKRILYQASLLQKSVNMW